MKNIPDNMVDFYGEIEDEIWKDFPIEPFNLKYEISNYGRVISKEKTISILHPVTKLPWNRIHKKKFRKLRLSRLGYVRISLKRGTTQNNSEFLVHRIVALAFLPNDENKPMINHIDAIKHNNHVSNLEWTTAKENFEHSLENGLQNQSRIFNRLSTIRPVYQLDKITLQVIRKFDSIIEASKFIKCASNGIIQSCRNESKTSGGYKWKYAPQLEHKKNERFVQIDSNTNEIIKVHESRRSLRKSFKNTKAIENVCENLPYFKTAYGFKWKYLKDYDQEQQDKKTNNNGSN